MLKPTQSCLTRSSGKENGSLGETEGELKIVYRKKYNLFVNDPEGPGGQEAPLP